MISIFSIVMGADYSSQLKSMHTGVPMLYAHNNFCLDRLITYYLQKRISRDSARTRAKISKISELDPPQYIRCPDQNLLHHDFFLQKGSLSKRDRVKLLNLLWVLGRVKSILTNLCTRALFQKAPHLNLIQFL